MCKLLLWGLFEAIVAAGHKRSLESRFKTTVFASFLLLSCFLLYGDCFGVFEMYQNIKYVRCMEFQILLPLSHIHIRTTAIEQSQQEESHIPA